MEINIKSIDELIEFVNREDVSKEDALKVAEKCFGVVPIVFKNEAGDTTYTKADIIEKINSDKPKRIWIISSK